MTEVLADGYRRWAELEAKGVSPIFHEWATGVAGDPEVLDLVAGLPGGKRQPNLVFAAARWLGFPVGTYQELRAWLVPHWGSVREVALSHATQTNEAGRCAVLLPLLSRFDEPLALIEVGASAGLCLYPDRYSYRYRTADGQEHRLDPASGPSPVVASCTIEPDVALPMRLPTVAWRAGIDLNPIDVRDPERVSWLETLVWPEHEERRARLAAAARLAAQDPPPLVRGDLVAELPGLLDQVPPGTRPVVFHSAVMVYLDEEPKQHFVDLMASRPEVTWISNEGRDVFPEITGQVRVPVEGRTILAENGVAHALVGPHGQSYQAL